MQTQLSSFYDKVREALLKTDEAEEEPLPEATGEPEPPPEKPSEARERQLNELEAETVERLFRQAREDRSKAFELKGELDRLGVFRQYEDRFLDLFEHREEHGPGA